MAWSLLRTLPAMGVHLVRQPRRHQSCRDSEYGVPRTRSSQLCPAALDQSGSMHGTSHVQAPSLHRARWEACVLQKNMGRLTVLRHEYSIVVTKRVESCSECIEFLVSARSLRFGGSMSDSRSAHPPPRCSERWGLRSPTGRRLAADLGCMPAS